MSNNHHLDYLELSAVDLDQFRNFYERVFGWQFQAWGPDYCSFSLAGWEGGVRGGERPIAGTILPILYAEQLEATEQAVVAGGGEILERHEFPGGRRFHFRDPCGNVLGVWTKVSK